MKKIFFLFLVAFVSAVLFFSLSSKKELAGIKNIEIMRSSEIYEDYKDGNPVKIKFVATWCPICQKELTEEFVNSQDDNYIYVFGNYGADNIEKVEQFLKKNPHLKSVVFDKNSELRQKFGIKKVPTIKEVVIN